MINVHVVRNEGGAEDYFDAELSRPDYYAKEGVGAWRGKAAERLGLHGNVQRKDFVAVLRNRRPEGGRLTLPRTWRRTALCGTRWMTLLPTPLSRSQCADAPPPSVNT